MGSLFSAHPCSLIWSSSLCLDPTLQMLCLGPMSFTLKIWRACASKFSLSLPCPPFPLSNVLFNPLLPDGLSRTHMIPWVQVVLFQLCQFVYPGTRKF